MDGDSIPRCTIAARSLRRVLLRESREYLGVPSPQLVATSVVSPSYAAERLSLTRTTQKIGDGGNQHTAK